MSLYNSIARQVCRRSLLRSFLTVRNFASSLTVDSRAEHLLGLSVPLPKDEPSLLYQQRQLLESIPEPASPANLDLALKVFDKVALLGTSVDKFSCARLILMCINSGVPEKGLEPWMRLLEELSNKTHPSALSRLLARPDFEPAAMAALAAYFLVSGPSADMDVALKLVPRQPLPQGLNALKSVGSIKSPEAAQAAVLGLAKLRQHVTKNFTSDAFEREIAEAPFARVSQLWKQVNMVSEPSKIPETAYAAFMKRFAETRQTKRAFEIWQQLADNVTVTSVGWGALLKTSLHLPENSASVFDALWQKMEATGFKPDAACYTERLLRLTRNGGLKEAESLFEQLQKRKLLEGRAFNVMINALAKAKQFDKVDKLLAEAQSQGQELTTRTFNPLLQATRGNPELSSKYLRKMIELGVNPDIYTYTFAVDQQMKRGQAVGELLAEMQKANIKPSEEFQTMLVYNLGQTQKDATVARELMATMLRQKMRISLVTLGAFIELELKYGDVQRAVQYVEMIQKFGLAPNVPTYNQLIAGALRRRDFEVANQAFDKLSSGTYHRLVPNVHTYMAMLQPWTIADLQNKREARSLVKACLPSLERHPELMDYALVKQIERIAEHAPDLVPTELTRLAHEKGGELYNRKYAPKKVM